MKKALVIASVVLAVAAGSLAVQTVWALFTDSQSSTGSVNFTSETGFTDLYICDVSGTASTSPTCPAVGDDSGADEIIFEDLEDLLPGDTAQWDIRFRNVGTLPWDSPSAPNVGVIEVDDPSGGCNFVPSVFFRVLGKAGDILNDNHGSGWAREDNSNSIGIHVEPGDFEDVRVRARLTIAAGNVCLGNVWDLDFTIGATQHP